MKTILQKKDAKLREIAEEINIDKITSSRIKKVIMEMKKALASQDDGVAIAGPQIGYSLRIFVVSSRVKNIVKKTPKDVEKIETDSVFINPVIKKLSKEKNVVEEGCLSVRYLYGKVSRAKQATIEAYDENGNKFINGASGLLAQIFQHEIDHLNGILFIDKAKNIEEILPTNNTNEIEYTNKNAKTKHT